MSASVLEVSVLLVALAPVLLLGALALAAVFPERAGERLVRLVTSLTLGVALIASLIGSVGSWVREGVPLLLSYGHWFGAAKSEFALDLVADRRSLGFAALALVVSNVVAAFSLRYLHRERGFHRFFVQLAMFVVGITLIALAGSIEVLFVGWELLGLSSALLVGFFHERAAPVRNALRVFAVYRLGDAAMLAAVVVLHHGAGTGSLSVLFARASVEGVVLDGTHVLIIGLLLLVAVAAKSALWPLSGWLPRAMEGPTPSTAVFYGGLSVHAGCFLLLKAEPLLAQSEIVQGLAVLAGVTTAVYGNLAARVQTDIKSVLSYSVLTQVGLIVIEIALGFTTLAFVHIVGHVSVRLLQFLSAPNLLHDLHELENRLGGSVSEGSPRTAGPRWLYLFALERGFADALIDRMIVGPFVRVARALDALDRLLAGGDPREETER